MKFKINRLNKKTETVKLPPIKPNKLEEQDTTCQLEKVELEMQVNHIGNLKPFPHDKVKELLGYFTNKGMRVIITCEVGLGRSSQVEHVHFWCPKLTVKKETMSKHLRDMFPFLKRPTYIDKKGKKKRGGEQRVYIFPIQDKYQWYYLFKEFSPDNENFYQTNHYKPYRLKTLKALQLKQKHYLEAYQGGAKGKFLQYLIDNDLLSKDPTELMKRHIDYQRKFNHNHITINNTIANINYVLIKKYPYKLKDIFFDKLQNYYLPK